MSGLKRTISASPDLTVVVGELVPRSRYERRLRGVSIFSFAIAGLVLGHALAYVLAVPDPHHRDLILARTGHDYLPALTQLALILSFAAAATAFALGALARRDVWSSGSGSLAARLVVVQVCAFVGQELVERVVTGAPLADLVQDHLLLAGISAQIVVALAGAALLRWLTRTAARLTEVSVTPFAVPRFVPAFALPAAPDVRRHRDAEGQRGQRAPPVR
jgi:hypothetical protein